MVAVANWYVTVTWSVWRFVNLCTSIHSSMCRGLIPHVTCNKSGLPLLLDWSRDSILFPSKGTKDYLKNFGFRVAFSIENFEIWEDIRRENHGKKC